MIASFDLRVEPRVGNHPQDSREVAQSTVCRKREDPAARVPACTPHATPAPLELIHNDDSIGLENVGRASDLRQ